MQACVVNQVLQGKDLMHRGHSGPEPRLHGRAQAQTLGVGHEASVEECRKKPQQGLADRDGPVVAGLRRVTTFMDGRDQADVGGGRHDASRQLSSAVIAGTSTLGGSSSGLGAKPRA